VLTIRPAGRDDLQRLVEIYNHYVERSVSTFDTTPTSVNDRLAWFEAFSETGPFRLFVASDGDRVLGCASSSPYRSHSAFAKTVEVGIYLDPDFLGQGIGSALYAVLFEALLPEDIHVALAGIALPNEASVALHRKFGFTEVGVFHEYAIKNGGYIDSLWMERRF
jgi:phosphinothricin acetyltransferase